MAAIAYARVSTQHQSVDQQVDALAAAGYDKLFTDQMSGLRTDRPGLTAALDYARKGDALIVTSLDRLGRTLTQILATVEELQSRGIILKSLREAVDFSTSTGRLLAAIFAALSEYEVTLGKERATAAREARAARDKPVGRPRKLSKDATRQARTLREGGESIADICTTLGVSRATLYRTLSEQPEVTS